MRTLRAKVEASPIQQPRNVETMTGLIWGPLFLVVRRYMTAKGRAMPRAKDTGAKARLNHAMKLGERPGKAKCIHRLKKLLINPEVRSSRRAAMKNFMLNTVFIPTYVVSQEFVVCFAQASIRVFMRSRLRRWLSAYRLGS